MFNKFFDGGSDLLDRILFIAAKESSVDADPFFLETDESFSDGEAYVKTYTGLGALEDYDFQKFPYITNWKPIPQKKDIEQPVAVQAVKGNSAVNHFKAVSRWYREGFFI